MDEEIKKDLKEIKENVEKNGKSSEFEEENEVSPEKADLLIEDLKKEEPEKDKEEASQETEEILDETSKKPLQIKLKKILLIIGITISSIFIILGILMVFNLIKSTKIKKEKAEFYQSKNHLNKTSVKEKTLITSFSQKKFSAKIKIAKVSEENSLYKFELKNFLIPLDSKVFLNTDVVLFFSKNIDPKNVGAMKFVYKEIIYKYLKNISPGIWLNFKKRKELEKKLKKIFENKKIEPLPQKIEFDGVILKG